MNSRHIISILGFCFVLLVLLGTQLSPTSAQSGDAYTLIEQVNALRAANGLPPYQINAALMNAAQSHSNYQASIGSITHTGAGGSRPSDRAKAAGYGAGTRIFISENIAGGTGMTPQRAVHLWQGDAPHLNTMLSPNYQDVGAGVATDGNMSYFTLEAAYIAGEGGAGSSGDTGLEGVPPVNPTAAPVAIVIPVQVVSPELDGSIIHIVQSGQVLINIAKAYQVPLQQLLDLNGLTENSIIYPGDKIMVEPAEATLTPTVTATSTPVPPTATYKPSKTQINPTAQATISSPPSSPTSAQAPLKDASQGQSSSANTTLVIAVGTLVLVGTTLVLVIAMLKRAG